MTGISSILQMQKYCIHVCLTGQCQAGIRIQLLCQKTSIIPTDKASYHDFLIWVWMRSRESLGT